MDQFLSAEQLEIKDGQREALIAALDEMRGAIAKLTACLTTKPDRLATIIENKPAYTPRVYTPRVPSFSTTMATARRAAAEPA